MHIPTTGRDPVEVVMRVRVVVYAATTDVSSIGVG
jgi:hypothetical protein